MNFPIPATATPGMVQRWDHPANNQRYGYLFNDHRHRKKYAAAARLNETWTFGANLQAQSGGPVTAFGVAWPNDSQEAQLHERVRRRGGSGWICVQNCSGSYAIACSSTPRWRPTVV